MSISSSIKSIAQAGLIAKGTVYVLLGLLAFMAAFHIGDQRADHTSKKSMFGFIEKQTGGPVILVVLAIGLLCYSAWRMIQTFRDTEDKGTDPKGLAVRGRYFFSGLVYASLAFYAVKILFAGNTRGNNKQEKVQEVLNKPFGEWIFGIIAIGIFSVGVYQCFYGLSERYRKHLDKANHENNKLFPIAGKIGYVARGIVWLILGWMSGKAALHSNSAEAGDTSKAFSFLAEASYGSYLLAATAVGLICYGLFNFIRVRHDASVYKI